MIKGVDDHSIINIAVSHPRCLSWVRRLFLSRSIQNSNFLPLNRQFEGGRTCFSLQSSFHWYPRYQVQDVITDFRIATSINFEMKRRSAVEDLSRPALSQALWSRYLSDTFPKNRSCILSDPDHATHGPLFQLHLLQAGKVWRHVRDVKMGMYVED
jgi:hypothetical protein